MDPAASPGADAPPGAPPAAVYYLIVTNDLYPPDVTEHATREALVAAARAAAARAAASPADNAGMRLFVFYGVRVPLTGEYGRELVFPDGARAEVLSAPPPVDDGRVLPPGWRPPA